MRPSERGSAYRGRPPRVFLSREVAATTASESRPAGTAVGNLRDYSKVLKQLEPGHEIVVRVRRGNETLEVRLTATKR